MFERAKQAALSAGKWIASQQPGVVAHKGPVDLVTQVDLGAEERIREILSESGVPVFAEEGGGAEHASTRWIVDPLDGTTNFVHGFPSYGVSIALEVEGVLEVGVVYDIPRDRLFAASRGQGATCNGRKIQVSSVDRLSHSLVASGFAVDRREHADDYLRFLKVMLEQSQGFRRAGAAALDLCHVACGELDGFWEFNLSSWDVAAGCLILSEAGGRFTDIDGSPLQISAPRVLATNGLIHEQMHQALAPLLPLASD
jgi:myo-inositol-1(or 4)-monophosphatase